MAGLFMPPASSQQVSQTTTTQLPAQQAQLLGTQATQYQQQAPLQTALTLGSAGGIGASSPNQFAPALQGQDPQHALQVVQQFAQGQMPTNEQDKQLILSLNQYGTNPGQLTNVLGQGAPYTAGTQQLATQLASELAQAINQPSQQASIYSGVAQSPLAHILQQSAQLSPAEVALPGAIGATSQSMAGNLSGLMGQLQGLGTSATNLPTGGLSGFLAQGPNAAISPAMQSAEQNIATANQPLDTAALMDPLAYAFSGQGNPNSVAQQLRDAAIRAGQTPDLNSSGYMNAMGNAARQYGTGITDTLAQAELQRRANITNAQYAMSQSESQAATNQLRAALGLPEMTLQGIQTGMQGVGQQAGMVSPLYQMLLAGPQAQAGLGLSQRQAQAQAAGIPLSLLQSANVNVPGAPSYPTTQAATTSNIPSLGAQIGSGIGGAAGLGLAGLTANQMGLFGSPLYASSFGGGQMVTAAGLQQEALGQNILANLLGQGAGATTAPAAADLAVTML